MARVRPPRCPQTKLTKKPKRATHPTTLRNFATTLFDASNVEQLRTGYADNTPFKHIVVGPLFRDDLLQSVKDECIEHLSFTEKETDIYKVRRRIPRSDGPPLTSSRQVNQTGDLASLSYLSDDQRALFPSLLALRDGLYSSHFRAFLRAVTGCGPLSGAKQDMAVNSYARGCHPSTTAT